MSGLTGPPGSIVVRGLGPGARPRPLDPIEAGWSDRSGRAQTDSAPAAPAAAFVCEGGVWP
ncbi:hypothetical protein FHR81_001047 [Actinoalloteichus hoggarensis]|uniref:Uncharacterized protein n=1 Tax=Actinoalloteichus hoggarensis TaxID=1470176 RepID=A0A221VZ00_9PSEU|nr:hypothetical protein AHOG_05660 [Actinoalloteichus hoggarensis]MBB5920017.1 hypothetical protein [Actinoalloteichus hoggarensis]